MRLQIILITLGFFGAYVVMRNMPASDCKFLHYEVTEVLADGTEVCKPVSHAGWLDLSRIIYPVQAIFRSADGTIVAGRENAMTLIVLNNRKQPLLPHELAVTHTERIHIMLVDPALDDYQHLHPVALGNSGEYSFTFTPKVGGSYTAFVEVVPVRTRRQVVAFTQIEVEGTEGPAAPSFSRGLESTVGDLRFRLNVNNLRRGRDIPLGISVERTDPAKGPVELELVMGALGHLVAFNSERTGYKHMHPLDLPLGNVAPDGQLQFLMNLPQSGQFRIYAQVRVDGEDIFAPFDIEI